MARREKELLDLYMRMRNDKKRKERSFKVWSNDIMWMQSNRAVARVREREVKVY